MKTLLRLIFVMLLSVLVLFSTSAFCDQGVQIINYGIFSSDNNARISKNNIAIVPLKLNTTFGIDVSIERGKYQQLRFVWQVPKEMSCKPSADGQLVDVSQKSTQLWSWRIGKDCEMVPGIHTIKVFSGDQLLSEKAFTVEPINIEYGIFKKETYSTTLIFNDDVIPLHKNIIFGINLSFPYKKYRQLKYIYEVPSSMTCKPKPEGYFVQLRDETSRQLTWQISNDCEMIEGDYKITAILDDEKVAEKTFKVVPYNDYDKSVASKYNLPTGFHSIKTGMTLKEVEDIMKINKFVRKGDFRKDLIYSNTSPVPGYDYVANLEYIFTFEGRYDNRYGYDPSFKGYEKLWSIIPNRYARHFNIDRYGLSFIPAYHVSPNFGDECRFPLNYAGSMCNLGFNTTSKLISFEVRITVKEFYATGFVQSFIENFSKKYGPPNASAENCFAQDNCSYWLTEATWYDGKTLIMVGRLNWPPQKTIRVFYKNVSQDELLTKLRSYEEEGKILQQNCNREREKAIKQSIQIQ